VAEKDDYLVDILVDLGFVSPDKVAELRREAEAAGVGVVDLMVANKVVRPADVTQAKAAHFGAEVVNLSEIKIADDVIAAIPRHIARKYRAVAVAQVGAKVYVLAKVEAGTRVGHVGCGSGLLRDARSYNGPVRKNRNLVLNASVVCDEYEVRACRQNLYRRGVSRRGIG
jgi:hypothetical protein